MAKRRVKVLNMINPGDQIEMCVNDDRIIIQHGATVTIDVKFIDVLKNAKVWRKKRTNAVTGLETPDHWFQKYEVIELEEDVQENNLTSKQKGRKDLAEALDAKE